ncbi:MAG: DUF2993 domain-containing protein [Actinomycetota bacterium]|nr:DUF2993 domain-containing protein [Actinomycetota bacterium]
MRRLPLLLSAALILILLGLAQLLLPGIATQRLREQLARSGEVLAVEVHAFPAIELLWHHADRVVVRMGSYRSSSPALGASLDQLGGVGSLDASVQKLTAGLLRLRDASLHKRGSALSGSASITEGDLQAAVPFLQSVQPVAQDGSQLVLRGTATLLGITATVDATVTAAAGEIRVAPDVPFGGLATVTVFSNPHLDFRSLSAQPRSGGFTTTVTARLR